jgi:hypothetical protein
MNVDDSARSLIEGVVVLDRWQCLGARLNGWTEVKIAEEVTETTRVAAVNEQIEIGLAFEGLRKVPIALPVAVVDVSVVHLLYQVTNL